LKASSLPLFHIHPKFLHGDVENTSLSMMPLSNEFMNIPFWTAKNDFKKLCISFSKGNTLNSAD